MPNQLPIAGFPKCDPSASPDPLTIVGHPIPEHTPSDIHHDIFVTPPAPVPFPGVYHVDLRLSRHLTGCELEAMGASALNTKGRPIPTPAGALHLVVEYTKEDEPVYQDRLRVAYTDLKKIADHRESLKAVVRQIAAEGEAHREAKAAQLDAEQKEANLRREANTDRDKQARAITFDLKTSETSEVGSDTRTR